VGISRRPAHGGETATWASEKGASRSRNTPGRLVPFSVIRFSGGPTALVSRVATTVAVHLSHLAAVGGIQGMGRHGGYT